MSRRTREKEIHYGGPKKINQIYLKIVTQGFLGSLITDLHSDLKHSKWQLGFIKITQVYLTAILNSMREMYFYPKIIFSYEAPS